MALPCCEGKQFGIIKEATELRLPGEELLIEAKDPGGARGMTRDGRCGTSKGKGLD